MPKVDLTYRDWQESDARKDDSWRYREDLQDGIGAAAAALSPTRNDVSKAIDIIEEYLAPWLFGARGEWLNHYDNVVRNSEEWSFLAARRAVRGELSTRRDADSALAAVEAAAKHEGIVENVSNHSVARGFSLPVGRLWSSFSWDFDDEVKIVSRNSGAPKTLFGGKTGQGKSTTLATEVEDRFNNGLKIVDLVDTDEFENGVYDIPQQQQALRDVREDFGLPADFTESEDYKAPSVEILVPLTSETAAMDIPVNDDGDSVVRPFTVPASDLDETTLVSFLSALVSKQQEAAVRTAYDEVDDNLDDWSLRDLAECIAERDEMSDDFKRRAMRLLENLQSKGFIRTKSCPHAIDWGEIFGDAETITSFSVAPLADETDQLMVLSYLFWAVYHKRQHLDVPPAAAVARELHEVVPHREEAQPDDRAKALQKAIASNLSYILKKNRHQQLEIMCDTQDIKDLKKGVRKRFSRVVAFKMPQESLKSAFRYVGEHGYESASNSIGVKAGEGAVIGISEPNVTREIPFLSPIQFAPPSFHHFDVDEHSSGFETRCDYLDETMTAAPWAGDLDDEMRFTVEDITGETAMNPYQEFAQTCLVAADGQRERAAAVYDAYANFCEERGYDVVAKNWFSRKFNEHVDSITLEKHQGAEHRYYLDVSLNQAGNERLPAGGTAASAD